MSPQSEQENDLLAKLESIKLGSGTPTFFQTQEEWKQSDWLLGRVLTLLAAVEESTAVLLCSSKSAKVYPQPANRKFTALKFTQPKHDFRRFTLCHVSLLVGCYSAMCSP